MWDSILNPIWNIKISVRSCQVLVKSDYPALFQNPIRSRSEVKKTTNKLTRFVSLSGTPSYPALWCIQIRIRPKENKMYSARFRIAQNQITWIDIFVLIQVGLLQIKAKFVSSGWILDKSHETSRCRIVTNSAVCIKSLHFDFTK